MMLTFSHPGSRIPDPGVKKHPIPDPGSRIRIRNTAAQAGLRVVHLNILLLPAVYPYLSSSSPARSLVCRLPRLACRLCT